MAASPDDSAPSPPKHKPVLLRETIQQLDLSLGLTVVDGTVGAGGHSQQIIKQIGDQGQLIGLDRDPMMLQFARERLPQANVTLKHSSYADLPVVLNEINISGVDRILVDLGLSSDQLEHTERGFGFSTSGRLDMRFDESKGKSASEFINTASRPELMQIFEEFGEEKYSSSITDAIINRRIHSPIETVDDLNQVVESAIPDAVLRHSDKHPATRVYQALRIAVNDELQHVQRAIAETFPACLNSNGILAVITFHSLEDRIVKRAFQDQSRWENLTTKPITPRPNEQKMNPRSRSAKLRAAKLISKNPQN